MSRLITGFWGAILEAWAELRIHRTRVLLSLIGVAVAVAALTGVVALGQIAEQSQIEQFERQSGRPAMLSFYAYKQNGDAVAPADTDAAFATAADRYSIEYTSRSAYSNTRVQFANGAMDVTAMAVDVDYGTMHRVQVEHGRWFTDADENRLAPVILINEPFWQLLGSPDLSSHPTAELLGVYPTTAVVIGVVPTNPLDTYPAMTMLYSSYVRLTPTEVQLLSPPSYEMWVPPEMAEELTPLLKRDIAGALGKDVQADVQRNDYLAWGGVEQSIQILKLVVIGGALLVLLLGALGLLNISLVTVRQRIREIGIRRSFGATASRVFFAVMMESVVATVVAGAVGVLFAILIVQSPFVQDNLSQGVIDLPPFPVEAAVIGIVASVVVGALAGLLPAVVAVRVKVIDAIRY